MLGYVIGKPRKKDDGHAPALEIPPDLRRRLHAWVDVEEVGAEGFWLWLRAVLPLLPNPTAPRQGPIPPYGARVEDVRELQRRIVVYAREQARLTVMAGQYVRDNEILTQRLRALEAALRTLAIAGHPIEIPVDEDGAEAAERYGLPRRRRPSAIPK